MISLALADIKEEFGNEDGYHKSIPRNLPDVQALELFAESIRYSNTYYAFLQKSHELTMRRLENDPLLINTIRNWGHYAEDEERMERSLHRFVLLHNLASEEVSGIRFIAPAIQFFKEEQQKQTTDNNDIDPGITTILNGYHSSSVIYPSKQPVIALNTHPDSCIHDPVETFGVLYHESLHHQQFTLGHIYRNLKGKGLGQLLDDGNLWNLKEQEKATIPWGLYAPYRKQFHEVAAFQLQKRFIADLIDILGLPPAVASKPREPALV